MNREQNLDFETARFWGWGPRSKSYDAAKRDRFISCLTDEYGLPPERQTFEPPRPKSFKVPESKLKAPFLKRWRAKGLSVAREDRILHACGKSYRDLVRLRSASLERYPDGVFHVSDTADLLPFFKDAAQECLSIVPFGGGTGVVGGTECAGPRDKPVVVIELKGLNRLLDFDEVSRTATFEAGVLGPDLERALNERGFTLGHFPQSFEFSTLGGWVATRSAGQNSTKYGKIEHLVHSLTLISPAGVIRTNAVPASATGPSLKEMLVGSEGIYGIITEATVRVSPLPEHEIFLPAYFKSFSDGIRCFRRIIQSGLKPSLFRLSNERESELLRKLAGPSALERLAAPLWFGLHRLGAAPCFALVAFEGDPEEVVEEASRARRLIGREGGAVLNRAVKERWKKERFDLPYLRDDLMDRGYFIETLETAAPWSKLQGLYDAMRAEFQGGRFGGIVFGAHVSHAYPDGASLYFTFIGRQKTGSEIEQWEAIKTAATEVVMGNGGTLSHHHGIGSDHRRWMEREHSRLALQVFTDVKNTLDPDGLLNPGKVI